MIDKVATALFVSMFAPVDKLAEPTDQQQQPPVDKRKKGKDV